eukprot:6479771-Amphidinium_carterae.1
MREFAEVMDIDIASMTAPVASYVCMMESPVSVINWYPAFETVLQLGTSACTDFMLHCLSSGAPPTFVYALLSWLASRVDWTTSLLSPHPSISRPCGLLQTVRSQVFSQCARHRTGRNKREKSFALRVATFNARSLLEPGKLLFVAKKLALADIDILCVQESRFRDSFSLTSIEGYQLCTMPAEASRGGLLVMVKDRAGLTLHEHQRCSQRVLRVSVKANGMLFHILDAHAPTEEDIAEAHSEFGEDLLRAVRAVHNHGKTLICVDLNAKLRGVPGEFAGPLAASSCRYLAAHRQLVIESLDKLSFRAMNTYLGPEKGYTWKHPSGQLQQIDFICACPHSAPLVTELHLEPWGLLDLQTTSDHRMVTLTLECGVVVKPAVQPKKCSFVSDEHFDLFAQRMQSHPPAPWDGSSPPAQYVSHLMQEMQVCIAETKPSRTPRKPWISQRTWSCMELLNKYRKLLSALHRGDSAALSQLAAAIVHHDGEKFFPADESDAIAGCISAIKSLGAIKKRLIKADRKVWLQGLCERVQGRADSHDLHNFHKTIRQLCRSAKTRKGLRLMDDDGVLVDDADKVDHMWHCYWRHHFSAADVTPASFSDRDTRVFDEGLDGMQPTLYPLDDVDEDITEQQILQVIKRLQSRRASPDPVPARAWKVFAPLVASPLASLFTDFKQSRSVPLSYAGSQVVGVFKRKGSPYLMSNFRPVSLMMVEAKLFSRLLLEMLQKRLSQHRAQFGSGDSTGTVFPQLVIRQAASAARKD